MNNVLRIEPKLSRFKSDIFEILFAGKPKDNFKGVSNEDDLINCVNEEASLDEWSIYAQNFFHGLCQGDNWIWKENLSVEQRRDTLVLFKSMLASKSHALIGNFDKKFMIAGLMLSKMLDFCPEIEPHEHSEM